MARSHLPSFKPSGDLPSVSRLPASATWAETCNGSLLVLSLVHLWLVTSQGKFVGGLVLKVVTSLYPFSKVRTTLDAVCGLDTRNRRSMDKHRESHSVVPKMLSQDCVS